MPYVITTNHHPRPVLDGYELTAAERADNDWVDWPAVDDLRENPQFVRYRGELYPLSDFSADWGITRGTGLPDAFTGWDGYLSDSFFSGVLIRYTDSTCEEVIVARFYARD